MGSLSLGLVDNSNNGVRAESGSHESDRASLFASPKATCDVLTRFGIKLEKSLGQNFLINDSIVRKILDLANVCNSETLLEVGPGIGTLTSALLRRGAYVVAVEKDKRLPEILSQTLADFAGRIVVVQKDALQLCKEDLLDAVVCLNDSNRLENFDAESHKDIDNLLKRPALPSKFVANLPYAVAATVVLDYFEDFSSIDSATVMVQKEVAERMQARTGTKAYGAYTVKLSLYAKVSGSFNVAPGNFIPAPHVDSTVIRLDRVCSDVSFDVIKAASMMADAAFASRRKTIANSCKSYFKSQGRSGHKMIDALGDIFYAAGIDPAIRGERLTTDEFIALGESMVRQIQD